MSTLEITGSLRREKASEKEYSIEGEKQTRAEKAKIPTDRVLWLQDCIDNIEETQAHLSINRVREYKCSGLHLNSGFVKKLKSVIPLLSPLSDEALHIPCNETATIYCNSCMAYYCADCHQVCDQHKCHDCLEYSSDIKYRKNCVLFAGFQPRSNCGKNRIVLRAHDRCMCKEYVNIDTPIKLKAVQHSTRLVDLSVHICGKCDDIQAFLGSRGYKMSSGMWCIHDRFISTLKGADTATTTTLKKIVNDANMVYGRCLVGDIFTDVVNYDVQLNAHLEKAYDHVLPSKVCSACKVPDADPRVIKINPKELITDATPCPRKNNTCSFIPENASFPHVSRADSPDIKALADEIHAACKEGGSSAQNIAQPATEDTEDFRETCTPGKRTFDPSNDPPKKLSKEADYQRLIAVACDHNFIKRILLLMEPGERPVAFLLAFADVMSSFGEDIDVTRFIMDASCKLKKPAISASPSMQAKYPWWTHMCETLQTGAFHRLSHKFLCQLVNFFQKGRVSITGDIIEAAMAIFRNKRTSLYHMYQISYISTISNLVDRANRTSQRNRISSFLKAIKINNEKLQELRNRLRVEMITALELPSTNSIASLTKEEKVTFSRCRSLIGSTNEDSLLKKVMDWPMRTFFEKRQTDIAMRFIQSKLRLQILMEEDTPLPAILHIYACPPSYKSKSTQIDDAKEDFKKQCTAIKNHWSVKKPSKLRWDHPQLLYNLLLYIGFIVMHNVADDLRSLDADDLYLIDARKRGKSLNNNQKAKIQSKYRANRKDTAATSGTYQKASEWLSGEMKKISRKIKDAIPFKDFGLPSREEILRDVKDGDILTQKGASRECNSRWRIYQIAHFIFARKDHSGHLKDRMRNFCIVICLDLHFLFNEHIKLFDEENDSKGNILDHKDGASTKIRIIEDEINELFRIFARIMSLKAERIYPCISKARKLFIELKLEFSERNMRTSRQSIIDRFEVPLYTQDKSPDITGKKRKNDEASNVSKRQSRSVNMEQDVPIVLVKLPDEIDPDLLERQKALIERYNELRRIELMIEDHRIQRELTVKNAVSANEIVMLAKSLGSKHGLSKHDRARLQSASSELFDQADLEEALTELNRDLYVMAEDFETLMSQGVTGSMIREIFDKDAYAGDDMAHVANLLFARDFPKIGGWSACALSVSREIMNGFSKLRAPAMNLQHCISKQHYTVHGWFESIQGVPVIDYMNSLNPMSRPTDNELQSIAMMYKLESSQFYLRSWNIDKQSGPSCFYRSVANAWLLMNADTYTSYTWSEQQIRSWFFNCLKNRKMTDPQCWGKYLPVPPKHQSKVFLCKILA